MTVLAIDPDRRTNADLLADVATLGYLPDPVLDATYGRGAFWTKYRPTQLTTNDLRAPADHAWDWTTPAPPEWAGKFGAVVFDPPYKLNGTPTDSDRYGVDEAMPVSRRLEVIETGAHHCAGLVRPRGFLLVKTQAQVACGRVHWQPALVEATVADLGFRKVDELHLVHTSRPQRSQVHARRNHSTLSVFRSGATR